MSAQNSKEPWTCECGKQILDKSNVGAITTHEKSKSHKDAMKRKQDCNQIKIMDFWNRKPNKPITNNTEAKQSIQSNQSNPNQANTNQSNPNQSHIIVAKTNAAKKYGFSEADMGLEPQKKRRRLNSNSEDNQKQEQD